MPSFSQPPRTRLMARTPARCPKLWGRPRRRAQRPLPSMMIPTWRGTAGSFIVERRLPEGRTGDAPPLRLVVSLVLEGPAWLARLSPAPCEHHRFAREGGGARGGRWPSLCARVGAHGGG